ncbi:glycosyltransferase family 1 protein [Clostridium sp. MB40-C1]|uniref:glycosyltransferase n=1 Tax=Clostridium sp. MB40-C1 TaxID=3070996 RepID=UPI0027E1B7BB|nr:glycosyltransferase [Clostridium sp. MB40-C1]WMJ81314.1 glycosyltransferase family 1 protein [Clostridium sp. MB40-C1]
MSDVIINNRINKIKKMIEELINKGFLEEAKKGISEYENVVNNDIDICSMKAVISIMEGDKAKAKDILNLGLENSPLNSDLLFNMSYLMELNGEEKKALYYFCKAKFFNPNNSIKLEELLSRSISLDNNNLRVVQGTIEIANQMNTITSGLKKINIDAKTLNYYPSYLRYKSDYTLNVKAFNTLNDANIETKKLASRIIVENDVFHFHFGTSLTLDYSDLSLLKELNKKIFMQHHGSDIRMYSRAVKLSPYVKVKNTDEDEIKRNLEFLSKHIDNCIVGDYELREYVKDYYSNINIVPISIDISKFKFNPSNISKKMIIVHAPTSPEIKGSQYVLSAMEEIKLKYPFVEFKLVQGLSHDEALKIYSEADLIIDQLLIGNYGVLAIECMAMGKPVVCHISDFMKDKYPKELPIISANPSNLKERLDYIIKNRDILKQIGINSRKYVETYHDSVKNSSKILNIYKE